MVRTYGTVPPSGGHSRDIWSELRARRILAAVAGSACLAMVASVFLLSTGGRSTGPMELSDLDNSYPEALQDLMNHINISEKKSW